MFPRLLAAVAAAMALLAAPVAVAAGNIATVDYQRLVKEAPQVKASDDLLKQRLTPREKAIKRQRKIVKGLRQSYAALGPATNPLERSSAAQKLESAQKKLGNMEGKYTSTLTMRRQLLRTNFRDVVMQDIQNFAKAHGYTMVVDDAVVYSASSTDITDAILAKLKAQYSKVQAAAHRDKKGQ